MPVPQTISQTAQITSPRLSLNEQNLTEKVIQKPKRSSVDVDTEHSKEKSNKRG